MQHPITSIIPRAALLLASAGSATDSPQNPRRNLYFGETPTHTAHSLDAFIGGTRQTPADAYRAARGETVVVNGQPHRIRRPLDFAAVTERLVLSHLVQALTEANTEQQ